MSQNIELSLFSVISFHFLSLFVLYKAKRITGFGISFKNSLRKRLFNPLSVFCHSFSLTTYHLFGKGITDLGFPFKTSYANLRSVLIQEAVQPSLRTPESLPCPSRPIKVTFKNRKAGIRRKTTVPAKLPDRDDSIFLLT